MSGEVNIRFINPEAMPKPRGYTQVVEVRGGRTVYIAGQVAFDREGKIVGEGDLHAQAVQVFENIKAGLSAVGADFSQVAKINMYVLDASQIQVVRDVRDQYVNTQNPPASTALEVRNFVVPGLLVEIDAVVVIPE